MYLTPEEDVCLKFSFLKSLSLTVEALICGNVVWVLESEGSDLRSGRKSGTSDTCSMVFLEDSK